MDGGLLISPVAGESKDAARHSKHESSEDTGGVCQVRQDVQVQIQWIFEESGINMYVSRSRNDLFLTSKANGRATKRRLASLGNLL